MKTFKTTLLIAVLFAIINPMAAQMSSKEIEKELKSKSPKVVRKGAKQFKKDGFYVSPGALPIEKQLHKAWAIQYKMDDEGYPLFIVASGNAVGETQTAAKLQATETAKMNIAGQIKTQVAAMIESNIGNKQLNNEDAASVTQVVASSKHLIAQEIGRTIPVVEMYKKINKNVECNVQIAYNMENAKEMAKRVIRQELEKQGVLLKEQLDTLMDF